MDISTDSFQWLQTFLIKNPLLLVVTQEKELAEELHKPVIRKLKK